MFVSESHEGAGKNGMHFDTMKKACDDDCVCAVIGLCDGLIVYAHMHAQQ